MWRELRMAQSGLGMATAPASWVQGPGAQGGAVELVSKDPLKDAILSQSWTSFYIFPLTDYWGKNWPCLSFSSVPFPTSFSSSKTTSLISVALRAQSAFSTGSGLSHINLSAHSRDHLCNRPQARRLASQPCILITFSTGFAKILSLLTGFLPLLFLPWKHAGETWQSPAFVSAGYIICSLSVESLTSYQALLEGTEPWD